MVSVALAETGRLLRWYLSAISVETFNYTASSQTVTASHEHSDCMDKSHWLFISFSLVPHFGRKTVDLEQAGIFSFTKEYYHSFCVGI